MQSRHEELQSVENQLARELRRLDDGQSGACETRFREELRSLLDQYGFSAAQAADILFPEAPNTAGSRQRRAMVFRNPYTREVVRTRSYNHATLKDWRRRHGRLTVQLWQVR